MYIVTKIKNTCLLGKILCGVTYIHKMKTILNPIKVKPNSACKKIYGNNVYNVRNDNLYMDLCFIHLPVKSITDC